MESAGKMLDREGWILLSQGAEARIWKIPASCHNFAASGGMDVVAKERFSKSYRHPTLDERLTKQRCRAEARILTKCFESKNNGVINVPAVLRVDPPILYMEFISGNTLRIVLEQLLDTHSFPETIRYAQRLGQIIAEFHNLEIVHGDLTTSNMIVRATGRGDTAIMDATGSDDVVLIDFGLAKGADSAEERAVDWYVLERALASTHPRLPENFLPEALQSYKLYASKAETTLSRLEQVRLRGRKRECFG